MADAAEITCPMCGFKNPADAGRCRSCGAKVEVFTADYTEEEEHARRHQQEDFRWSWALIAAVIYLLLQGIVLAALPRVIYSFDPQGLGGLGVSVLVWFIGGMLLAIVSPGRTYIEAPVGVVIAVVPVMAYIQAVTPEGFRPTLLAYVMSAMMGVMIALIGAFVGEKLESTLRPNAAK